MSKTIEEIGLIVGGIVLGAFTFGAGTLLMNLGVIISAQVAGTLFAVGVAATLSGVGMALRQDPQKSVAAPGQLSINQGISYRRVVYGRMQVAGVLTFLDPPPKENTNVNSQLLEVVYTLTGHEISSFDAVVINGIVHNFGNDLVYDVPTGFWYCTNTHDLYFNHIGFEFDLGNPAFSGQPFPILAGADVRWTSACKQQGRAKVHVQLRYDASAPNIYPNGQIPNIQFLITGKKLIDPRVAVDWIANANFPQYSYLVDSNGYVWVQMNATTGNSSANQPDFNGNEVVGTVLADGALSWRNVYTYDSIVSGSYVGALVAESWLPNFTPARYVCIEAPIGYLQMANVNVGSTGTTRPVTFNTTRGGTTTDNAQTWICLGRSRSALNPSNAALCVNDYLTDSDYGMAASPASVDPDATSAAANVCDEQVVVVAGAAGTVSENRYTCNGMFDHSSTRGNVLVALLSSMAGFAVPPGDKWRIYAGSYIPPAIEITDSDLRDTIKGDFRLSRRDICNGVKGTFIPAFLPSSASNINAIPPAWQSTDFPPFQSAAYLAEDGGQIIWKDIQLDFTTSLWMAQRLAKITLERLRRQQTLTLPCKLKAYQAQAGDTIMITHPRWGIYQKVFIVTQVTLTQDRSKDQPSLGVDLVVRETDSTVYDFTPPSWVSGAQDYGDYSPYGTTGVL